MFKLMLIRNKLTQVVINKPNKIKYPSYSFKNKPKKHRAIIKPLDQPEKEEEKEQLFIKPKMGKEDSKFLKQINEKHIKEYYSNVKEFIMDFDSNNNNMLLWYIFHTVPLVITITYSPLLLWVHQVFWVSTSMGLVFCSYEMYSSKKEKEILDDHMNKR